MGMKMNNQFNNANPQAKSTWPTFRDLEELRH
jgi:hypothetical protein